MHVPMLVSYPDMVAAMPASPPITSGFFIRCVRGVFNVVNR